MTVPYLMSQAGAISGIAILALAFGVSAALHLMVADMLLLENCGLTILPVFRRFLFRGKLRRVWTGTFFALLCVVLVANLAAYVAGGGEIIASLTSFGEPLSRVLFYLVSIVVPLCGLKALGLSEKAGVAAMVAVVLALAAISFLSGKQPISILPQNGSSVLALYGGVMFCLSALFSVPQAVSGLERDRNRIRRAAFLGLGLNALLTLILSLSAIRASRTVTKVAIIGWAGSLGRPVRLLASLFVLLAMLTSFWAIALALGEMAAAQLPRLSGAPGFIAVTLPSLLITFIGGAGFLSFISVTGGAVAVIVALLLLPAYWNARREGGCSSLLGPAGDSKLITALVGAGYLLMAAGSLISV